MRYEVQFSDKARKALKQIDHYQAKIILSWIEKNLAGCYDPRVHGKAPRADERGYWRYRIGTYRIIAEIDDSKIKIFIINIAHRREVYDQ